MKTASAPICPKRFLLSIALVRLFATKFLIAGLDLLLAFFSVNNQAQAADSDAIVGLWASERVVPLPASGQLTIEAEESKCRATIAGLTAPVQRGKGTITFTLPHNAGEFRGRLNDSRNIVGHWIQPANQINNNPSATPVELA
jgi:hypothetical protein